MARAARWMRTLLAYASPAYLALVLAIAVGGAASPWPAAREALAAQGGRAVMVGIAQRAQRSPARGVEMATSRYYLLLPGVFHEPRLLRVTQVGTGPVQVGASRTGFWLFLAALAAALAGTGWFWFGPGRADDATDAGPDLNRR